MHKGELKRIPDYYTPMILGSEFQTKRSPRRMVFEFRDREISSGLLRYEGKAETLSGEIVQLRDNEEYLTCVNPFNRSVMFVSKLDGSYIGVCKEWKIPSRADFDGAMHDYGKVRGMYNEQIKRVNRLRGVPEIEERKARMAHNTEVMAGVSQADIRAITAEAETPRNYEGGEDSGTEGFGLEDFIGD